MLTIRCYATGRLAASRCPTPPPPAAPSHYRTVPATPHPSRALRQENIRRPSADTDEVEALAPEPELDPDTKPETGHRMVYLKFLSAACAIGAALMIAVALRTKAAPPDSRGTAVEALKASRLLH